MNNKILLSVSNISKTYRTPSKADVTILEKISFEVRKYESLGIIGENGSGKSSLLKIIAGSIKPSSGVVNHYGNYASILELGFGMVPELSGLENIFLMGSVTGLKKQEIRKYIEDIIDFSGLGNVIQMPVKNYSSGMYLRLAFSINLMLKPDLLILDEVMSVGDIEFQTKCRTKIREIRDNGASLILVSHNMTELIDYTSNTIQIEKGKIKYHGATSDIVNRYIIESTQKIVSTNKSPKDHTGEKNNKINIKNIVLSKTEIRMDEPLNIKFEVEVLMEGMYDIILFISDFNGIVLSDSVSYRSDFERITYKTGTWQQCCTIPANVFNKGKFNVGFIAADREKHYFENYYLAFFEVKLSEWDVNNVWNQDQAYFPLRPQLVWG